MATPIFQHQRADEFEELLWQITGELAMTPASASLAGAPFLDLEPDPEPEAPAATSELPESPRSRMPRASAWLAGFAGAALLALASFGVGQVSSGPAIVTALELHDQHEHSAVMAVAHGPATQIPVAPERPSAAPATAPEPEVEEAKPEPKPKKRRVKRKAKPKPPSVPFEDL